MDFQPSSEQKALQQGIRAFCEDRVSLSDLASLEQSGGFERSLWQGLAELGVFSICLPERDGGTGRW